MRASDALRSITGARARHRDICLIPMSAHGTNPASAQMVGWKVVVMQSAQNGDIDLEDFRAKAESTRTTLRPA